jgi:hypothetical protein
MNTFGNKQPLELNETMFVAMGARCNVYRHPECAELLIKVLGAAFLNRNSFKIKLTRRIPLMHRYRLSKCFVREVMENIRLRYSPNYKPPTCIQKIIGFVDTNYGLGFMVKAETAKNGDYASTLKTLIKTKQVDEHILKKLNEFYVLLTACDLSISDLRPRNIVYAYDTTQGHHFVLIDGIGENTLIPILKLSAYLRKKSRIRQINALKQYMSQVLKVD